MKKNQTTSKKTFKLQEQTAIDVINSLYCYDLVKFFVELIPDLILNNDCSSLNQQELQNLGQLIKTMTMLIDSSEMTALLNKFSHVTSVRLQPNTPLIKAVDIDYRSKILSAELLTWTNNLPQERKRKLDAIEVMKEFFLSAFFFSEFIKWLDYVSNTVVIGPSITVILGQSKRKSLGQKIGRHYGGHWAKDSLADYRIKTEVTGPKS